MKKTFNILCILMLSIIFVYAGSVKAVDAQKFFEDLQAFKLGSDSFLAFGATVLPYLEIVAGVALLIPLFRRGALVLILAQFSVFQLWLGQAWARGIIQDCPCFGAKGLDIRVEFLINIFLIAVTFFLFVRKENFHS